MHLLLPSGVQEVVRAPLASDILHEVKGDCSESRGFLVVFSLTQEAGAVELTAAVVGVVLALGIPGIWGRTAGKSGLAPNLTLRRIAI